MHHTSEALSSSIAFSLQVFDAVNFDMIAMLRLPYVPGCAEWIYKVRLESPCSGVPFCTTYVGGNVQYSVKGL